MGSLTSVIRKRKKKQSPSPAMKPPAALLLDAGAEVEVRIDDDGFRGSWFEATVVSAIPGGRGRRPCYEVAYSSLLSDSGNPLRELSATSHVRPRPPPPPEWAAPFGLHQLVEAYHNDGWWAGVISGAGKGGDGYTVAFPYTREVIDFPASLIRPRLDFVQGRWLPSCDSDHMAALYDAGEKVEVSRNREKYGRSWFLATIVKVISSTSFLIKYDDLRTDGEVVTELLDVQYIRPVLTPQLWERGFKLGPSMQVEVLCNGGWLPGILWKGIGKSGEYEVEVKGAGEKLLLTCNAAMLRPGCEWNGKKWRLRGLKRPANRKRQSVLGKRPSSPVDLTASGDDDGVTREPDAYATKRSRKGNLTEEELQSRSCIDSTEGSGSASNNEMEPRSQKLMSENRCRPKCCSSLSVKNHRKEHSPEKISTTSVALTEVSFHPLLGQLALYQQQSRMNAVDGPLMTNKESTNKESKSDRLLSKDQLAASDHEATSGDACDMLPIAVLGNWKSTSRRTSNAFRQKRKKKLIVLPLERQKVAPDIIQLEKGTGDGSTKENLCDLIASKELAAQNNFDESSGKVSPTHHSDGAEVLNHDLSLDAPHGLEPICNQKKVLSYSREYRVDGVCEVNRQADVSEDGVAAIIDSVSEVNMQTTMLEDDMTAPVDGIPDVNGQDNVLDDGTTSLAECAIEGSSPIKNPTGMHTRTTDSLSFNCQVQQDGRGVEETPILPHSENVDGTEHNHNDLPSGKSTFVESSVVHRSQQDPLCGKQLSFLKHSSMWESIEAMEVFRQIPQQPHFLPLQQYLPELREGMALGLMVSFANLVGSLGKLHIEDSTTLFEEKLITLALLEANGFNVQILQSRLNKLIKIKNGQTEYKKEKERLKEKILEKKADNARVDALLDAQNAAIVDLEQKLNFFLNRKESLAAEKACNDAEITRLEMEGSVHRVGYENADQHFNNVLAEPW